MARKLIVGIDYGTTFTGVSYAWSDAANASEIYLITSWASNGSSAGSYGHQNQVPSKISYGVQQRWGYGIEAGAEAFCWTKLLLDRHASATEFDDKMLREIDGGGILTLPSWKSAEQVVTDFLQHLYNHVMKHIAGTVTSPILEVTAIDFWFTVPALWSIRAQEATRVAARRAGFGSSTGDTIHMIKEPEAAAMASLNSTIHGNKQLIKAGEGILVCDCGGGTVDLSSYDARTVSPKLILDQVCFSEGAKCGSTTIDRAFHGLVQERFGAAFSKLPPAKKGANSKFMAEFESRKRAFGSLDHDRTYGFFLKMDVEDSQYYEEDECEVLLSSADMRSLFYPVVERVIGLLKQQVEASQTGDGVKIKTILLVAGFGASRYLQDAIDRWCKTMTGLTLVRPEKSWEAICLGATVCGLQGRAIETKKARYHIGFVFNKSFRKGIDDEKKSYIDWFTKRKMTRGRMAWPIKRGETITPQTEKSRDFTQNWLNMSEKKWTLNIWQCTHATAPDFHDANVQKLGVVEIDLTGVNLTVFPSKKKPEAHPYKARKYYKVEYEVVIVPENDLGFIHFKVLVRGETVGEAKLNCGIKAES
ncbi:hypothetical protein Micbo1qcDRAFT_209258 [Microdochium bolleyi]|uniref:Actin-like ATPase domain-containing protein n=1 Tax=Microdochium bolleyi TaxID=196109 RepID=A0A136IMZ9_9PEZI|nr:hypothetical protein Micbo1qcDRAFT_209258 [Microdochium bolleyi]